MRVIAKAYTDRPLERVVTGIANGLVYLINPSVVDASGHTPCAGVGFPIWAVFEYDSQLADSLARAWESNDGQKLEELWMKAKSFNA